MESILIRNVMPFDEPHPVDLLLEQGWIAARGHELTATAGTRIIDGSGYQAFPGLVDGHAHLDKTLLGREWFVNEVPASLSAMIDNERHYRREQHPDPQLQSERIARQAIATGTSFIRTHVDIDNESGLANLEGILETRHRLAGKADIEIVAFPQSGILKNPGTEALLNKALEMGAGLIGGLDPCSYDRDPQRHLTIIFELAQRHNKKIDIHLHERGELGAFSLELLIEYTRRYQMLNRVTLSHGFCLGMIEPNRQQQFAEQMAELGISVATTAPADIAVPPYELLNNAGVAICAGNDGVRDTWSPYGNGDMVQRAVTMGLRYRWRQDKQIMQAAHTITYGGARVLDLKDYGLQPGNHADLVLIPGRSMVESLVTIPRNRKVFKAGKIIADGGECLF